MDGNSHSTSSSGKSNQAARKYLIFRLGESQYAIPLSDVKEVIGLPKMVSLPGSPDYFLGLMNLRGSVISTIDLRKKLGLSVSAKSSTSPAVILVEGKEITVGNVVDAIVEVQAIPETSIERTMEVNTGGPDKYVDGVVRFQDRPMIIVLDIKKAADVSEFIKNKTIQVA